jgi:membrane protein YdbS with pleckstrin-like domain
LPAIAIFTRPLFIETFGPAAELVIASLLVLTFVTLLLYTLFVLDKWLDEEVIVTNQRLIVIPYGEFIWEHRAVLPICDIQNVYMGQTGLGPIFGFADVAIKTATDENPAHFFYGLEDPFELTDLVMAQVELCSQERRT